MSAHEVQVGSMPAREAFALLRADPAATLVDVRTHAEWTFVGVPDLSELRKEPLFSEWQAYPSMQVDEAFAETLESHLATRELAKSAPLLFLCRSGARSLSAARRMAERGYTSCINISDGFEGPCDPARHRGRTAGWKAAGLPWIQA